MKEQIVGQMMAFKNSGEGDEYLNEPTLIEVTDFTKDGDVEIAFNSKFPGQPRIYLKFSLPKMMESAMLQFGVKG